ncbi:MAG: TRP75-related protein [Wolbachia endosymbiont of Menacanthus eurysternus]|nr:MAG: TRP75-related protein [Wolbachia endosymbiont of Menacanthus eurysternus]
MYVQNFCILIFCFSIFISYSVGAKSKVGFSKKYIPQGNPGGAHFYEDEDFVKSYILYEKRRELMKKKKLQAKVINASINRENLIKELKKRKVTILDKLDNVVVCASENGNDNNVMINQYGINIACLKGAVFIDHQIQHESEKFEDKIEERVNPMIEEVS